MMAVQMGQYTFEVDKDASKVEIAQAIELAYPNRKVKKVRTVYMPSHEKKIRDEIWQNTIRKESHRYNRRRSYRRIDRSIGKWQPVKLIRRLRDKEA